jgi:hypothetical protein
LDKDSLTIELLDRTANPRLEITKKCFDRWNVHSLRSYPEAALETAACKAG